jgi:hypothetical protein
MSGGWIVLGLTVLGVIATTIGWSYTRVQLATTTPVVSWSASPNVVAPRFRKVSPSITSIGAGTS